jgi:gliding motility-associated-like protein
MRYLFTFVLFLATSTGFIYGQTVDEEDSIVVTESSFYADSLRFYDFISPNDDGHNEFFVIDNIQYFPNSTLLVYNIWGDLVYSNPNYQNEFYGRSNAGMVLIGQKLPDGVYYYTLIDTLNRKHSGKLTIKR